MLPFSAQIIAMEKPPRRVITAWENKPKPQVTFAWHLDAIYENPNPWELRESAIKVLSHVLTKKGNLAATDLSNEQNNFSKALEIAQSMPGATNFIRALIASSLNKYCDWNEEDEQALAEYAIQPVPNLKMILLIQLLKNFGIRSIGIGNQDPMEHDIFVKKLQTGHDIRLYDLFVKVLGTPFIDRAGNPDFTKKSTNNSNNFFVAACPYPSEGYFRRLKTLIHYPVVIDPNQDRCEIVQNYACAFTYQSPKNLIEKLQNYFFISRKISKQFSEYQEKQSDDVEITTL